jgi:uncharacterized glyoxalase superfamily protein PhnB
MKTHRDQSHGMINSSMLPGVVIPGLAYPDVHQAVEWFCNWFGFVERLRIGNHRSQLTFGKGSIIVTGQSVDPSAPISPSGVALSHSVMVRVDDVDSHYERTKQSGTRIVSPPADYPYGERQYSVDDLAGHRWTFSQTIADVDPSTWGRMLME